MPPQMNTWWQGKWYGPSYPDAGDLPPRTPRDDGPIFTGLVFTRADGQPVVNAAGPAAGSRPAADFLSDQRSASAGVTPESSNAIEPPPRSGPGSSKAKWATYATARGVTAPSGADRDGIIAALEAANVSVDRED